MQIHSLDASAKPVREDEGLKCNFMFLFPVVCDAEQRFNFQPQLHWFGAQVP